MTQFGCMQRLTPCLSLAVRRLVSQLYEWLAQLSLAVKPMRYGLGYLTSDKDTYGIFKQTLLRSRMQ